MADNDSMSRESSAARRAARGALTEPGEIVGGYELLREIGRGGMAEVWVARKANSIGGKFVALKMILPQYVGDERYSRMFRSEAEVSAPLSHSNVVQVFDEGEDTDGRSYLVMEWVDGVDLARLAPDLANLRERDPHLRLRVIGYIVGQVLHGLSYAHKITSHRGQSLGIVHRDVSPQNVLVSVSGDVKITDFGIAHRMIEETSGIHVKGKLRYMAPEHLAGQSHSPTVDLYAVGAIIHELLDGRKFRHDADDQLQLYHQVLSGKIPAVPDDTPRELDELRIALLQADPKKRPQTADAALLMLKRWPGYSEMKVELGMICGMMTGIVRPRTGPMITGGSLPPATPSGPVPGVQVSPTAPTFDQAQRAASSIPTESAPPPTEVLDAAVLRAQQQRPRSEPTVALGGPQLGTGPHPVEPSQLGPMAVPGEASRVQPPRIDPRDLEPTHSSIVAVTSDPGPWGATPAAEPTMSRIYDAQPRRSRGWIAIAAAGAALAVLGGVTTAWLLAAEGQKPEDARVVAVEPKPAAVASDRDAAEPFVGGPTLEPVAKPEPTPAVAAPPEPETPTPSEPVADPVAPPKPVEPASSARPKPTPSKPKPTTRAPKADEPTPAGPPTTVHFRLDGGLTEAEVKIGSVTVPVKPRYQSKVPAGKHAVKWRPPGGEWKSVGSVTISEGSEWKLFVGPSSARVEKL